MDTKEYISTLVAAILAFGILVGGVSTCTIKQTEIQLKCLDKANALECKHLMGM